MGVAIGRGAVIQSYLDSGELIAPFKSIPAGMSYSIICPKGMEIRPKFKAFTQWLHNQYTETKISIELILKLSFHFRYCSGDVP